MSSRIRSTIGIVKRRLEHYHEDIGELPTAEDLAEMDYEELTELMSDILDLTDKTTMDVLRLKKLDTDWRRLQRQDSAETKEFERYVALYGNYRDTMERCTAKVVLLEQLYHKGVERAMKLEPMKSDYPTFSDYDHLQEELEEQQTQREEKTEHDAKETHDIKPNNREQYRMGNREAAGQRSTWGIFGGRTTGAASERLGDARPQLAGDTHGGRDGQGGRDGADRQNWNTPEERQPQYTGIIGSGIPLPTIRLPTFDGREEDYFEFKEGFENLIGSQVQCNTTKMYYLKSSLRGEAADLVKTLRSTASNYPIAWSILEDQYGGQTRLQQTLFKRIRELPVLGNNYQPKDLHNFYIRTVSTIRQLVSFGCNMNNMTTASLIEAKLPKRIIQKLYANPRSQPPDAERLLEMIRDISQTESLVSAIVNDRAEDRVTTMATQHQGSGQHHRSHHRGDAEQQRRHGQGPRATGREPQPCPFCVRTNMMHAPESCRTYPDNVSRRDRCRELNLCYQCLRGGHRAAACPDRCKSCRGRHHQSMCHRRREEGAGGFRRNERRDKYSDNPNLIPLPTHAIPPWRRGGQQQNNGFRPPQAQDRQGHNSGQRSYQTNMIEAEDIPALEEEQDHTTYVAEAAAGAADVQSTVSHSDTPGRPPEDEQFDVTPTVESDSEEEKDDRKETKVGNRKCLMLTAQLPVIDDGGAKHKATIFFDSGSNLSYVTTEFVRKLKIAPTERTSLTVATFASKENKHLTSNVYTITCQLPEKEVALRLCEIEFISSNITTSEISRDQWHRLLEQADFIAPRIGVKVDILIGMDWMHKLLGNVSTTGLPNGLQLHQTECGPLLSGNEHHFTTLLGLNETPAETESNDAITRTLQKFWEVEGMGTMRHLLTKDEEIAKDFFRETTTRGSDGRYEVRLPFIDTSLAVPVNRALAFYRMRAAVKKLNQNPELNSTEANAIFAAKERNDPEDPQQKILGVRWNTTTDCFELQPPQITTTTLMTRRKVLEQSASSYDPLGLLAPTILLAKLFYQKLWAKSHTWDSPLLADEQRQWEKIADQWKGEAWKIPRRYFSTTGNGSIELHVFSDASMDAYGTVAYLRRKAADSVETVLLMAKTRVAPLKLKLTIPQLEMLALQTGTQLAVNIKRELKMDLRHIYLWSDSKCTLDSLFNNTGSKFVRNRARIIHQIDEEFFFGHVAGIDNPADLASRGLAFEELKSSKLWNTGAPFLSEQGPLPDPQTLPIHTTCATTKEEPIIDVTRYGSFHRLIRVLMTIFYFLGRRQHSMQSYATKSRRTAFKLAQQEHPPSDDIIRNLRLQRQDDLWIFHGRIKKPLIYLPHGRVGELFVLDIHERHGHASTSYTLAAIREIVWITQGRSYVKKILARCRQCERRRLKPYRQPDFPQFPESRTQPIRPFKDTGMDFCGPVKIKGSTGPADAWILLFTCLGSRYVSTELVTDMKTTTVLNALRRLAATFGTPHTIICDNAKQFVMLKEVCEYVNLQGKRNSILNSTTLPEFKLIPAHSPWSGGVYERMVGILKNTLLKSGTGRLLMDEDDLRTVLAETTAIINRRPLTYIPSDANEMQPLRPIDIVLPFSVKSFVFTLEPHEDCDHLPHTKTELLESWSSSCSIVQFLLKDWTKRYTQLLRDRGDTGHRQTKATEHKPTIDDVVLIEQEHVPIHKWPMGRIVEVKDRSAKVINGRTRRTQEHPFKKMFPLEDATVEEDGRSAPKVTNSTSQEAKPTRRSPRPLRNTINSTGLVLLVAAFFATSNAEQQLINSPTMMNTTIEDRTSYLEPLWSVTSQLQAQSQQLQSVIGILVMMCILNIFCSTCTLLQKCWTTVRLLLRVAWIVIALPIRWIFSRCPRPSRGRFNVRRFRGLRHRNAIFLTIMLLIVPLMEGCSQVATMQANESVCIRQDDTTICTIKDVTTTHVRPNGTMACFELHDASGNLAYTVQVRAISIVSYCNQETVFYSRDYTLASESSHRCAHAGSCSADKCQTTKVDDDLPELSNEAKAAPGFTRCQEACGCPACGCFFCSPGCIFHRVYARPTSTTSYEVFRCPTWSTAIDAEVQINEGKPWRVELRDGLPLKIPQTNLTITGTGFSIPPIPLHGAAFIRSHPAHHDETPAFAFTQSALGLPGVPMAGTIGTFQCASLADARNFNCRFNEDQCHCRSTGTQVRCTCGFFSMKAIVNNRRLPINTHGFRFETQGNRIRSRMTSSSVVTLHLTADQHRFRAVQDNAICKATFLNLTGCYSCLPGAKLAVRCTAPRTINAVLRCPNDWLGYLRCSAEGTVNRLEFHSDFPNVTLNCSCQCGSTTTFIGLFGTLEQSFLFQIDKTGFATFHERSSSDTLTDQLLNLLPWKATLQALKTTALTIATFLLLLLVLGLLKRRFLPRCRLLPRVSRRHTWRREWRRRER
ncbi:unnamed protein product [Caenorhabditis bovis]|uniref:Integrase catalytic domain-containing protein n=1 Tax=Caenorhabditis bovis TaxID=2654633 RepID=A0A8S1FA91_9PELO|nr:unnamed protein product [Caenorhabditis bovis]